jgi:hypothetical protein
MAAQRPIGALLPANSRGERQLEHAQHFTDKNRKCAKRAHRPFPPARFPP